MAPRPLKNYIRSARLRAGFSQDELAFLVGSRGGKSVSRYELFQRVPTLETAFALESALGVSMSELFAGNRRTARELVERRARALGFQLSHKPKSKEVDLKRRTIERILGAESGGASPDS